MRTFELQAIFICRTYSVCYFEHEGIHTFIKYIELQKSAWQVGGSKSFPYVSISNENGSLDIDISKKIRGKLYTCLHILAKYFFKITLFSLCQYIRYSRHIHYSHKL